MVYSKEKKLVLTDGTWYFSGYHDCILGKKRGEWYSLFRKNPDKAYDFSDCKTKESLKAKLTRITRFNPLPMTGEILFDSHTKLDRRKFALKWLTITTTAKQEDFNSDYDSLKNHERFIIRDWDYC